MPVWVAQAVLALFGLAFVVFNSRLAESWWKHFLRIVGPKALPVAQRRRPVLMWIARLVFIVFGVYVIFLALVALPRPS